MTIERIQEYNKQIGLVKYSGRTMNCYQTKAVTVGNRGSTVTADIRHTAVGSPHLHVDNASPSGDSFLPFYFNRSSSRTIEAFLFARLI
jgi:hypothetical protein